MLASNQYTTATHLHVQDMLLSCTETIQRYKEMALNWKAVLKDNVTLSNQSNRKHDHSFILRKIQHYADMIKVHESEELYWRRYLNDIIIHAAMQRAGIAYKSKFEHYEPLTLYEVQSIQQRKEKK